MFHSTIYHQRREVLIERIGKGIVLLLGNGESPMNYADNTYPFRQDSTFLYYFGINEPYLAAVIDIDEGQTILFGDELGMDEIVWMGQLESLSSKANKVGVAHTRPSGQLANYLGQARQKQRPVHYLPPYRADNKLRLSALLGMETVAQQGSEPLIKAVVAQRSIKSAEEVAEIEKAVNTTVDMHHYALQAARPGLNERDLAAGVQAIAQRAGGQLAYPTIMSINGQILHNHRHFNLLEEGQLLLNDSGAETGMGYAGDLTRTFPVGKSFSNKQKEVYQMVLDALEAASGALKPGARYLDIHFLSCKVLVEGLKAIGLMKGDSDAAVAAGAHTLFFQCGTGHMMGLDVHDMEDLGEQYVGYTESLQKDTNTFGLKSLRLGRELQQGFVLTVEPGIYFIPELINLWKTENKHAAFINYDKVENYRYFGGIRIEDNLLITETDHRLLGKHLPKEIDEIEYIRRNSH